MVRNSNDISLSIFFPVYNDWGTIASMTALAITTADQITDDYEIILVNDGSGGSTLEVLNFLEKSFSRVRVVHHPKNCGYGAALRTGISEARKEFIFYTDGDAQYDVRELRKLVAALRDDVDVVNGYKIKRHDPWYRTVIGRVYHAVTKFAFSFQIRDVDCDFRLMRRQIFEKIKLERDSGVICVEMIKKISDAGFRFAEVPVTHFHRASGKSTFFRPTRIFRVGADLIRLWWRLVVLKEQQRQDVYERPREVFS